MGKDAASEAHHCRNTNVGGNVTGESGQQTIDNNLFMSIFRRIEHWAKDNPIKLTFLSYPIAELTKFIFDTIKGVNYSSLLSSLIALLNIDFNVKTWHVLVIGVLIITWTFIKGRWKKHRSWDDDNNSSQVKPMESSNIGLAKHPFNSSLTSQFLSTESGTFSIWGYATDIHNHVHPNVRYMYIIGYATNGGKESNNDALARYPNAWAIQRVTPSNTDSKGVWRFWCNNVEKKSTLIDCGEILPGGWHLFTVAWSAIDDYIKFIIDEKIVGEDKFVNWPSDFSSSVTLGTWPTRTPDHFFDSKIGPWRFTPSGYDKNSIRDFFKGKPSD